MQSLLDINNNTNAMTKKTITIIILSGTFSTGCSIIQERLSSQNLEPQAPNPMVYDFIQPRRSRLQEPTSALLQDNSFIASAYYSASGLYCVLAARHGSTTACLIDDTWQELAPVIVPKQSR